MGKARNDELSFSSLKGFLPLILSFAVTVGKNAHPTTKPMAWLWVGNPPYDYINPCHRKTVIHTGAVIMENSVVIPIIFAAALLLPPIASTMTKAAAATGVALIKNSTPNTVGGRCNNKPTIIAKKGDTVTRKTLAHSEKSLILNSDLKSKDAPTQINAKGKAVFER